MQTPFPEAINTAQEVTNFIHQYSELAIAYLQVSQRFLIPNLPQLNLPHVSKLFQIISIRDTARLQELIRFQTVRMVPQVLPSQANKWTPVKPIDTVTKPEEMLEVLLDLEKQLHQVSCRH